MKKYYKNHLKISKISKKQKQTHKLAAKALLRKYHNFAGPLLIAVGGPGGTGKTTFAAKLEKELVFASVLADVLFTQVGTVKKAKNVCPVNKERQ